MQSAGQHYLMEQRTGRKCKVTQRGHALRNCNLPDMPISNKRPGGDLCYVTGNHNILLVAQISGKHTIFYHKIRRRIDFDCLQIAARSKGIGLFNPLIGQQYAAKIVTEAKCILSHPLHRRRQNDFREFGVSKGPGTDLLQSLRKIN